VSKQRAKGTAFERAVANYLVETGTFPNCERTGSAHYERGDLVGTGDYLIECKNHKKMALAEWIDQAREASERTFGIPVVIHKRPRKNIAEAYVTMRLQDWAEDVRQAQKTWELYQLLIRESPQQLAN